MSESLPSFISKRVLRGRYLFLEPSDEAARDPENLAVYCAGWEDCAKEYQIYRNGFRFHALEFITGGIWQLESAAGKWDVGPGTIFTYGPDVQYSLSAKSSEGLNKYFVDITGTNAGQFLQRTGLQPAVPAVVRQRRWIRDILDQMIDCNQLGEPGRQAISSSLANLLLMRVHEDVKPAEPRQGRQSYDRCRRYFADHYLEISKVSEVADQCDISPVHLSRLFKRYDTESPKAHLSRLKMNHAAELILRGNLPVKIAAAEVGFDDPYHFSRVFKRVFGVSPRNFARQLNS